jgi:hypothetical protein
VRRAVGAAVSGVISSLLGVPGGELIIPTLVFVFGVGILLAGTLSLLISLPTILRGLYRQFTLGTVLRGRDDAVGLALPMAAGSAVGALGGGSSWPTSPDRQSSCSWASSSWHQRSAFSLLGNLAGHEAFVLAHRPPRRGTISLAHA